MIIYGLIKIIIFLISIPLNVIDVTAYHLIPDSFAITLSTFIGYTYVFNPIFPVTEFWALVASALTFEFYVILYKVSFWLFEIIRRSIRG